MEYTNQKHLTLEDRNYIEQALNQNMTFKEIGKFLSKDPTTIAKEIKKHRIRKEPSTFHVEEEMYVEEIAEVFVLSIVLDVILTALTLKKMFVTLLNKLLMYVILVIQRMLAD